MLTFNRAKGEGMNEAIGYEIATLEDGSRCVVEVTHCSDATPGNFWAELSEAEAALTQKP